MTQATYIPNVTQTKAQAFAFFQGALAAAASTNAGPTPPPETWPGMLWVDTAAKALRMRNDANSGWVEIGSFASGAFVPAGVTRLSEAQATDATGTAFGALSGTLLKAAVAAFSPPAGWHPYDMVATGDSATGVFYDFATEGTSQYLEAPTFEPGYDYMIRLDGLLPINPGVLRGQFWVPEPGVWTNGFDLTSAVQARVPLGGRIRIPDPLRPRPIGIVSTDYIYDQTGSVGLSATIALGGAARRTSRVRLVLISGGSNYGTFGGGRASLYRRREYIAD